MKSRSTETTFMDFMKSFNISIVDAALYAAELPLVSPINSSSVSHSNTLPELRRLSQRFLFRGAAKMAEADLKFTYPSVDLDQGLDMPSPSRGGTCGGASTEAPEKAKKEAPSVEKPKVGKTHLKDMIVLRRMVQEGDCPDGLDPQNPVYAEETSPSAIVNGFSERLWASHIQRIRPHSENLVGLRPRSVPVQLALQARTMDIIPDPNYSRNMDLDMALGSLLTQMSPWSQWQHGPPRSV
ncbi:hypothetical protein U0070_015655 [Myodes glareolus]|uniref:40S ribosomal protein S15 n=1 Tax=Myodes glareolus TaxID=447135 RepID=A0AAW0HQJ7_MYOGA